MKKFTHIINFFFISLILLLVIDVMLRLYPSIVLDINLRSNIALKYENVKLKNEYKKLNNKIQIIEDNLNSLNDYDTYINSKLLGLSIDSCNITLINDIDIYDIISKNNYENKLDQLSETINNRREKTVRLAEITKANEEMIDSYPNSYPLDTVIIGSKFGMRMHPIHHKVLMHRGVDMKTKIGSHVYATMDGIISKTKCSKFGYGNQIRVSNDSGYDTRYAHLSEILVEEGQLVKKGDLIGLSGNSGISTTPHLHYEVREFNKLKNPLNYIYLYRLDNYILVRNEN